MADQRWHSHHWELGLSPSTWTGCVLLSPESDAVSASKPRPKEVSCDGLLTLGMLGWYGSPTNLQERTFGEAWDWPCPGSMGQMSHKLNITNWSLLMHVLQKNLPAEICPSHAQTMRAMVLSVSIWPTNIVGNLLYTKRSLESMHHSGSYRLMWLLALNF